MIKWFIDELKITEIWKRKTKTDYFVDIKHLKNFKKSLEIENKAFICKIKMINSWFWFIEIIV